MAIMNHDHKDSQPHTETCPADTPIWGDGHNHFYTNSHAAEAPIYEPPGMRQPEAVAGREGHNHDPRRACIPECPLWATGAGEETRDGAVGELIDDRVQVYGDPVVTFARQAQAISALLGHEVHAWQVPLIMIMVKMVRVTEAPDYSDNSDDIEGYLDIFRTVMGEDMVHARSVKEFVELKKARK